MNLCYLTILPLLFQKFLKNKINRVHKEISLCAEPSSGCILHSAESASENSYGFQPENAPPSRLLLPIQFEIPKTDLPKSIK